MNKLKVYTIKKQYTLFNIINKKNWMLLFNMPKLKNITTFNKTQHIHDNIGNQGFDYHRNLLHKVVSQEMFANPINDIPFRQIERLIENLIDSVKSIKLHYAFAHDKNSKLIN